MTAPLILGLLLAAAAPAQQKWSRQWQIYVVIHSHADIGYTHLIPEVRRIWADGIDEAVKAVDKGFRSTLESSLLFDVYRELRKPEKVEQLARLLANGKMELASLYTNIESESAGPEELVRSTFFASERLYREYGIHRESR